MSVFQRDRSSNWFIEFVHRGTTVRKTSGIPLTRPKAEAEKIEELWRAEIELQWQGGITRRVKRAEKEVKLRQDLRLLRDMLQQCIAHIDEVIGAPGGK
jgi:hypothetical protein